jgi:hypothetical protein
VLELIDKKDNFEIVRDQIAVLLALESANQQALAVQSSKNPDDFKIRIFTEQSNPWEQFLNPDGDIDPSPVVNVWYESSSFDPSASNTIERQKTDGIFNIDCYGFGISSDLSGQGHEPGDQLAAFEVQKAVRLVRNILMAGINTHLQMQGLVWSRWPDSITIFQPSFDATELQKVVGARLVFRVTFNEFSPQVQESTLDYLAVDIKRNSDGQILAEADFDYTAT